MLHSFACGLAGRIPNPVSVKVSSSGDKTKVQLVRPVPVMLDLKISLFASDLGDVSYFPRPRPLQQTEDFASFANRNHCRGFSGRLRKLSAADIRVVSLRADPNAVKPCDPVSR